MWVCLCFLPQSRGFYTEKSGVSVLATLLGYEIAEIIYYLFYMCVICTHYLSFG
jgi:hypothetical protein